MSPLPPEFADDDELDDEDEVWDQDEWFAELMADEESYEDYYSELGGEG